LALCARRPPVGARAAFDYAIVRVVPHVDREEFINAGVILFCHARDYLRARIALDEARLLALSPDADVDVIKSHLSAIERICEGGYGSGPIGQLPLRERWHWLVATSNTILQFSAAHTGLCSEPEASLERILETVVRVPRRR
jgi:hypothetical protein